MKFNKEEVLRRKEHLKSCAAYLKEEFVGIDYIVDELISYLNLWYVMPELLTRPIIINLWGMTGVGKTDLVRKMVKFLDFQDRFAEIELSNSDSGNYRSSVAHALEGYEITDGEPAIVLFDEIQRFSTVNPDGSSNQSANYTDFWELLSDGRLSRKSKDSMETFLYDYLLRKQNDEKARLRGEKVSENTTLSSWEAIELRKNLGLNIGLAELTKVSEEQMYQWIIKAQQDKKIYEPVNHSKTLIIISGNLDQAYEMSGRTSDADIDADIFHAFTKKITLVDIKNALTAKFRPEQVARFGNIHLIYTSLQKKEFETLIHREVEERIAMIRRRFGVRITVTSAVERLIYRNGVFPVQGVRSVFSSIVDILESNWNTFIFRALMDKEDRIAIDYDTEAAALVGQIGMDTILTVPYVGRIDKIREAEKPEIVANISVHEAGHAVAYLVLTGMVPLQLKSKIASSYAGGFTFSHEIYESRVGIETRIIIYLAGGLAEELVFGPQNATTGRASDREYVSKLAIDYVRKFGFDEKFQAVYNHREEHYQLDSKPTDAHIEALIAAKVADARRLLANHRELLFAVSDALREQGSLEADEVIAIARAHGLDPRMEKKGFIYVADYDELLTKKLTGA